MNASLESVTAERSALAADVLRVCGHLRLQVHGESMLPLLWPHDVVEVGSCSVDEARPGDIVLALRGGRFFLHRFLGRRRPSGFLLQGDSMPAPDPQFPDVALIGRLVSLPHRCPNQRFDDRGYREQSRALPQFAANGRVLPVRPWSWAIGRLLCYCEPARRLALKVHAIQGQRHNVQKVESACRGAAIDLGVS